MAANTLAVFCLHISSIRSTAGAISSRATAARSITLSDTPNMRAMRSSALVNVNCVTCLV